MHITLLVTLLSLVGIFAITIPVTPWVTTGDQKMLLKQLSNIYFLNSPGCADPNRCIIINQSVSYQQIDGFGASMTESSAYVLSQLKGDAFDDAMRALFDNGEGIGISFVRVPMGTCDFALDSTTYDDTVDDYDLASFSIARDERYILPILRYAMKIRSEIVPPLPDVLPLYLMGSPWSPPVWMKTSNALGYGTLKNDNRVYVALAAYFTKFAQAYQRAMGSLPMYSVTPQNEPLFEPRGYAGMYLSAKQESKLAIEMNRQFKAAGLKTKIIVYDHNWDNASYPLEILANSEARQAIAGTAWHCYNGDVSAQSPVHTRYPEKETHLTECSGGQWAPNWADNLLWDVGTLIIGGTRNWAKSVLKWNLALDTHYGPTHGGCLDCRGFLTVDTTTSPPKWRKESEYYSFGHASKFVESGAFRIDSQIPGKKPVGIQHVAFLSKRQGEVVLLLTNPTKENVSFEIRYFDNALPTFIPARSVMTLVWPML